MDEKIDPLLRVHRLLAGEPQRLIATADNMRATNRHKNLLYGEANGLLRTLRAIEAELTILKNAPTIPKLRD
jgi:hypothetical protein